MERTQVKLILESLLFVSELPVSANRLQEIFSDLSSKELKELLLELQDEYENLNRSFYLREVASGFQFCTRPEYADWIKKLKKIRPLRFGSATMETLAIIAYKQPITRAEIEEVRGVDVGGILRFLLEKKTIRITGKKDIPGKPFLYGTTPQFLTLFGLKGLNDLPTLEEMNQFGQNTLPLFPKASPGGSADGEVAVEGEGDGQEEAIPD